MNLPSLSGQEMSKTIWAQFASAPYKEIFMKEYGSSAKVFDKSKAHDLPENKEITISGYFIPVGDKRVIVISKYPYAQCFFCGGAGIESIMEILPKDKKRYKFKTDEKITFKGTLIINDTEWQRAWFMLKDAVLVE